jgi:hypothetical protein
MLLLKSIASYDRSIVPEPRRERSYLDATRGHLHFHCAPGFCTQILAYMLDSLVRVSRRVDENHFVSIPIPLTGHLPQYTASPTAELCSPSQLTTQRAGPTTKRPRNVGLIPTRRMTQGYNRTTWPKPNFPTFPYAFSAG